MTFHWNGQGGYPSWYWGGSDGTNMYVYNPLNLPFLRNDVKTIMPNRILEFPCDHELIFGPENGRSTSLFKSSSGLFHIRGQINTTSADLCIYTFIPTNASTVGFHSVHPFHNGIYNLGTPSSKFSSVYCYDVVTTSDKKEKGDFRDINYESVKGFLTDITPMYFRFKQTPYETTAGMIAQEAEELIEKWKLPKDFKIISKAPILDKYNNPTGEYNYGMCYDQLIPLMLLILQKEVLGKKDTSINYEKLDLPKSE